MNFTHRPADLKTDASAPWLLKFFLSPWLVILGGVSGVYVGFWQRSWAENLAPVGEIYLSALNVCVLPMLFVAVASGWGRILRTDSISGFFRRMVVVLSVFMLLSSAFGILGGVVGAPGSLSQENRDSLGSFVFKAENAARLQIASGESPKPVMATWRDFFIQLIPGNLFKALSSGNSMQILMVAVLLGLVMGYLPDHAAVPLLALFAATYQAFAKMADWFMVILPVGLFAMLAGQCVAVKLGALVAMAKFLFVGFLVLLAASLLSFLVIWRRAGQSGYRVLRELKGAVFVAFGTGDRLVCLPASLQALTHGLKFQKSAVDLSLPFGISVLPFGNILYFSMVVIFTSQLYHVTFGFVDLLFVWLGSIAIGLASAGAATPMGMLGMLLLPLGLPPEAVLMLLIVVDPVIRPFLATANLLINCAATTVIASAE